MAARRVRQRIAAVMRRAIAEGHRADNPAGDPITTSLPRGTEGNRSTSKPAGMVR